MGQIFSLQAKEWTLWDGHCSSVPVPVSWNYPVEKIWLLPISPVLPQGKATEAGCSFAMAEGDVKDEWQIGKKVLIPFCPREQKQCSGCVVCTQFDDLRICAQSTGTDVNKCKTVTSITCGNVQKLKSRWEWTSNLPTLLNSPLTSTKPSWKSGWVWEERALLGMHSRYSLL